VSCCANCAGKQGRSCSRLRKRGVVTSPGTTQLRVRFAGEDQTIGIRAHQVQVKPLLLTVDKVIERIEDLRSLIPEQVPGDG